MQLHVQLPWDYLVCQERQLFLYLYCTSHSVFGCGDPGTPTNGQRTVSGTSTTFYFVTYTCDEGYTRQGSNMRICLSNGQWSGGVPQCNGRLLKHQLWYFSCNTICYILFRRPNVICTLPAYSDINCGDPGKMVYAVSPVQPTTL